MKYILFLMYFIAPPAPPEVKDKDRVWMLQSNSVIEFSSSQACREVGRSITESVSKVNTLIVRGWCFCETKGAEGCRADDKMKPFSSRENDTNISIGIETLVPPKGR